MLVTVVTRFCNNNMHYTRIMILNVHVVIQGLSPSIYIMLDMFQIYRFHKGIGAKFGQLHNTSAKGGIPPENRGITEGPVKYYR